MSRHLLRVADLTSAEITEVLARAKRPFTPCLSGRGAALVFEHPSARTRNAAEMAVAELGGHPVYIRGEEIGLDVREPAEDVARTLAGFYALIAARVARHSSLERMASALDEVGSPTRVVNLLSDLEHPTQALADVLTIEECTGGLDGRVVAFIGDANNVARSLAAACALTGAAFRIAAPDGCRFSPEDLAMLRGLGGEIESLDSAEDAARGADVLYTDVWVSMGEESAAQAKREALSGFQVNSSLLALAAPEAIVLHCLPVHRGEEVTAEVIDGPRSHIWKLAENRLHALRGLLSFMFEVE